MNGDVLRSSLAAFHLNHTMRHRVDEELIVRRDNNRPSTGKEVAQTVDEVEPRVSVLTERWLIKEENPRVPGKSGGKTETTTFAPRQALRVSGVKTLQPHCGSFVRRCFVVNTTRTEPVRGVLQNRRHLPDQFEGGQPVRCAINPRVTNLTALRSDQSAQCAQNRRFSRSVIADESNNFAFRQLETRNSDSRTRR